MKLSQLQATVMVEPGWNTFAGDWCAIFVSWLVRSCGGGKKSWVSECYSLGSLTTSPMGGDIAIFPDYHTGIVSNVIGNTVWIIAGNEPGTQHWSVTTVTGPRAISKSSAVYVRPPYSGSSTPAPALLSIKQGFFDGAVWRNQDTGLRAAASQFTAVNAGGSSPTAFYVAAGALHQVCGESTGWKQASTGLPSYASSLSAVHMGGPWPQVMSIDGGVLYQNVGTASGWQKLSTGMQFIGQISAARVANGRWPTVMLSQSGVLYQVWGDTSGWHVASTGLSIAGQISTVYVGGNWPEVYAVESGVLKRCYGDATGWHKVSTGITLPSEVSATVVGGFVHVFGVESSGAIVLAYQDASGWHKVVTGASGAKRPAAVHMSGARAQLMNLG